MHGSAVQTCKRSRHMWPVPDLPAATVAYNSSHAPNFFSKDGRKIRVGDCALFKPPQDSPPFVGIIRRFSLDKENNISLGVNWLYRPTDIKLAKATLLEAAPNEVFYSFHKDEISVASLLHPCKVTFLRKGVELPTGVSSFVCRRVYDIENKCLWWLTDKDYINERQEEVDKLLDNTKLEVHGAMQPGGRSPRPLNGASSAQLKSGSDSIQNSTSSSSQAKGKKRERGDQGSDSFKRERLSKTEDGQSGQFGTESMLRSEIKMAEKGGLVDFEGVERLLQLMQPDSADKKIDLAGRIMLVGMIAVTDRYDCLGYYVQLGGLRVLDEWLQEVHTGKICDSSSAKESDKSVEEYLLALLRALDKLPVNLSGLQTCNVGKSVNHLRSHKNSEIQKKVRSLVEKWKKRVEAEMNMDDAKAGSSRAVSWANKPASSEVSHVGSKKIVSSAEVGSRNLAQYAVSKTPPRTSPSPGATKSLPTPAGIVSKDRNSRALVGAGSSDLPLASIKEDRSSSSSQSQNNSQSSDHAKTAGSSCREDAKSSTAGSVSVNKIFSSASRHQKSGNGHHGCAISGVQKEAVSGRISNPGKIHSEKSSTAGVSLDKRNEGPLIDHGNNRLIVRLPNTGRSPARSGSSFEDQGITYGPLQEKYNSHERKHKGRSEGLWPVVSTDVNSNSCQGKEGVAHFEGNVPLLCEEPQKAVEDSERTIEVSKAAGSLPKIASLSGKSYEASLSSMNALIESCVKFSEASVTAVSASPGDDVGMNLLASVAAGEISKSENASPSGSPCINSPAPETSSCSGEYGKLQQLVEEVVQSRSQSHVGGISSCATFKQRNAGDFIQSNTESRDPVSHSSPVNFVDTKDTPTSFEKRAVDYRTQLNGLSDLQHNVDAMSLVSDVKHGEACNASVAVHCSVKESCSEAEGANQVDEQRRSVTSRKSNSVSDFELKTETPFPEDDEKVDAADVITMEDNMPGVRETAAGSAKVDVDDEKPTCSSSDVGVKNQIPEKESCNDALKEGNSYLISDGDAFIERKNKDGMLPSGSENALDTESKGEMANDSKAEAHTERINEQTGDVCSASDRNVELHLEREEKDSLVCSVPLSHVVSPSICLAGKEKHDDSSQQKIIGEIVEEQGSSSASASAPDSFAKLDFDLNEGFPIDDGSNGELPKVEDPGSSSTIHLPCILPFQISSVSGSFPTSITIAAPAKGPFVPPENPLRSKGELGWKGSAATSAFRPAEPRKNLEMPPNTSEPIADTSTSKTCQAPLDFDLNVPDVTVDEDVASQSAPQGFSSMSRSHDRDAGGLDLDLNRIDESPDAGPFTGSNNSRMDIPHLPGRSLLSSGLPYGGVHASRDFDLNDGPGLDDVTTETVPRTQPIKSSLPLLPPVSGVRVSSAEFGNFSSWFPPSNSYSAIPVPSIFPSRTDQTFVASAGSQRVLCPSSTSYGPEMYRGPVLSSTPAVPFPPTPPFQYPGFPFETSFPLSTNSFSGGSTAYMDSSGALCFPTTQLVGPGGLVSSPFPRPYLMSFPGGSSNGGPDGRKWTGQGLDLNAGPGNTDTQRRDERPPSGFRQLSIPTSQALAEEQLKMFQVGSVLKRKEPDSGMDPMDRISYKQPSWQ